MKNAKGRFRLLTIAALATLAVSVAGAWDRLAGGTASAESPLKFASSMPAGALVYLESPNLAGLLKTWIASPVRGRYFDSASYRSFTRSRLYLKIQERLTDLQGGFGVEVTDEWLAGVSGGPSALTIYDPSKLEMLFVTEVPRERALATTVFAEAKNFQERKTAKGTPYYSREVSTESGNSSQRIAFAWADGRLWIGTSDALLAEALDGPAAGGLGAQIAQTAAAARDFAPHDLVLWFDMERSIRNKYFNLYWIQRNAKDLEGISSGLVDLEFAQNAVHERRWYLMKTGAPAPIATDSTALARLERRYRWLKTLGVALIPVVWALLVGLVWLELEAPARRARALARDADVYRPHWERWAQQEDSLLARERTWERADLLVTTAS